MKHTFKPIFRLPVLVLVLLSAVVIAISLQPTISSNGETGIEILLSVVLALTGVTVPLMTVYLAELEPEIRFSIAQKIETCFSGLKITNDQFRSAYVDMSGANGGGGATDASRQNMLITLGDAFSAKDSYDHSTQCFPNFPARALDWFFKNMPTQQWWFRFFHDEREDRSVCTWYICVLAILGLACFIDLYSRHVGLTASWAGTYGQAIDRVLVLYTAAVNFTVYVLLVVFVVQRTSIGAHVDRSIWELCPLAVNDVTSYLQQSKLMESEMRNDLSGNGSAKTNGGNKRRPKG